MYLPCVVLVLLTVGRAVSGAGRNCSGMSRFGKSLRRVEPPLACQPTPHAPSRAWCDVPGTDYPWQEIQDYLRRSSAAAARRVGRPDTSDIRRLLHKYGRLGKTRAGGRGRRAADVTDDVIGDVGSEETAVRLSPRRAGWESSGDVPEEPESVPTAAASVADNVKLEFTHAPEEISRRDDEEPVSGQVDFKDGFTEEEELALLFSYFTKPSGIVVTKGVLEEIIKLGEAFENALGVDSVTSSPEEKTVSVETSLNDIPSGQEAYNDSVSGPAYSSHESSPERKYEVVNHTQLNQPDENSQPQHFSETPGESPLHRPKEDSDTVLIIDSAAADGDSPTAPPAQQAESAHVAGPTARPPPLLSDAQSRVPPPAAPGQQILSEIRTGEQILAEIQTGEDVLAGFAAAEPTAPEAWSDLELPPEVQYYLPPARPGPAPAAAPADSDWLPLPPPPQQDALPLRPPSLPPHRPTSFPYEERQTTPRPPVAETTAAAALETFPEDVMEAVYTDAIYRPAQQEEVPRPPATTTTLRTTTTTSVRPPAVSTTTPDPYVMSACRASVEIRSPFYAMNTQNTWKMLINMPPFETYIHMEHCVEEHERGRCSDGCRCTQRYAVRTMPVYERDANDCDLIYMDKFLFPSHCDCMCLPTPYTLFNITRPAATTPTPIVSRSTSTFRPPYIDDSSSNSGGGSNEASSTAPSDANSNSTLPEGNKDVSSVEALKASLLVARVVTAAPTAAPASRRAPGSRPPTVPARQPIEPPQTLVRTHRNRNRGPPFPPLRRYSPSSLPRRDGRAELLPPAVPR